MNKFPTCFIIMKGRPRMPSVFHGILILYWFKCPELLGIGCEDGTVSLMRLSSDNTFKYPLRHKHSVVCLQWKSCVKGRAYLTIALSPDPIHNTPNMILVDNYPG